MENLKNLKNNPLEINDTLIPSANCAILRNGDFGVEIFLLRKRPDSIFAKKMVLPGGHQEPKEDILETVVRESKEETNVRLKIENLIFWKTAPSTDPQTHKQYKIDFHITNGTQLTPKLNDFNEHDCGEWFSIDDALLMHQHKLTNFELPEQGKIFLEEIAHFENIQQIFEFTKWLNQQKIDNLTLPEEKDLFLKIRTFLRNKIRINEL